MITLIYSSILIYSNTYINFFTKGISLYNGLLTYKIFIAIISIIIFIITTIILGIISFNKNNYTFLTKELIDKENKIELIESKDILEYPLIILFCITGAIFLISSTDIISMFIALELQSYGLYLICSIYRNSEESVNAGLTYFLLGGLSSCIILLGQSYIYINTGSTNLENIYIMKNITESYYTCEDIYINYPSLENSLNLLNYIQYSLIIMFIGFSFKISAAPFHFWAPDVYDAIPTIVTAFVAIVAKISIFVLLLQLIQYTITEYTYTSWINIIIISSALSLSIGSILGLVQYRIKRLFAYSTISHIGFLLLSLSINSYESIQAFLFYLIQYSFSNLNAFIILIAIGYNLYIYTWKDDSVSYRILKDLNNSPIQLISQLKGYFYINPILSISFIITLFSFIGVPPLIGFFAKQMILTTALDNGYVFISLLAILTSVISAVYYLIIVKNIFSDETIYEKKLEGEIEYIEVRIGDDYHDYKKVDKRFINSEIEWGIPIGKPLIDLKPTSLASSMTLPISILSLLLLSFMFYNIESSLNILIQLD
jgi:NADH-ubiquinone oxidoreductase chain 2